MNDIDYYKLLGIKSPYTRFKNKFDLKQVMRGWNGNNPFLSNIVKEKRPNSIIEVGSFLGLSTITMAKACKECNLNTKILCVDTWLGSPEHWRSDQCNLLNLYDYFENGISAMYDQFIINMIVNKIDDMVIPIPNTSKNAFNILQLKNVKVDMVYIDGSHDTDDVYNDIILYFKLLNKNGYMFGDDYGGWESVRKGVHLALEKINGKLEIHDKLFWSIKL